MIFLWNWYFVLIFWCDVLIMQAANKNAEQQLAASSKSKKFLIIIVFARVVLIIRHVNQPQKFMRFWFLESKTELQTNSLLNNISKYFIGMIILLFSLLYFFSHHFQFWDILLTFTDLYQTEKCCLINWMQ